jgi:hypothetical protein
MAQEKNGGGGSGSPDHNFLAFCQFALYTRTLLSFPIFPSHRPAGGLIMFKGTFKGPIGLCMPMNIRFLILKWWVANPKQNV